MSFTHDVYGNIWQVTDEYEPLPVLQSHIHDYEIGRQVAEFLNSIEAETAAQTNGNTMLSAVHQFEVLDNKIRKYLYPKLYTLYNEKKLNKGHLPVYRTAKESITIREFGSNGEKIGVYIQIWWGGDNYDDEYVTLTCDEWDAIENYSFENKKEDQK